MVKYLLIVVLVLFSVKFYSQEWTYLGKNDKGDKTFIQNSSVNSNTYGYPKVWSKELVGSFMVQKNGKKFPVKNAIIKTLDAYDCAEKRTRLVKIVIYDANEKLVTNHEYSEYTEGGEWRYVTPETTAEARLDYVCANL